MMALDWVLKLRRSGDWNYPVRMPDELKAAELCLELTLVPQTGPRSARPRCHHVFWPMGRLVAGKGVFAGLRARMS
jgi:hypothetical protein